MNAFARLVHYLFVVSSVPILAIPPDVCFENFRWDDCGKPPVPVMYYYKPGSRCEVAMWRGCLPNPNMFSDEYACINTCIFVERADLRDYDQVRPDPADEIESEEVTEGTEGSTAGNVTEAGAGEANVTVSGADESGATEATEANAEGSGSNATNAAGDTTPAPPAEDAPAEPPAE